jgi:glucokinase
MKNYYLVGDIGGTKTELSLVSNGFIFGKTKKYISQDYDSLLVIIKDFLGDQKINRACFGVAGPVEEGVSKITNLPWIIDGMEIKKTFGISEVSVINDIVASAYAISELLDSDLYTINSGEDFKWGNRVIISPGTGLGEALLVYNEGDLIPVASEGGHSDFAPRNEGEVELLFYLKNKFGHVSYERVLSGPGLSNIYTFLSKGVMKSPEEISSKKDAMSREALKWFCEILGAESANLALKGRATGGVFLGGGIPPRILDSLKEEDFMRGFLDKGRFSEFLKKIPVKVILDSQKTLKGAAIFCENQKNKKNF